jgi:hypothetical protein
MNFRETPGKIRRVGMSVLYVISCRQSFSACVLSANYDISHSRTFFSHKNICDRVNISVN